MDSSGGGGNSLARLASFFGERNPFGGNFTWKEDMTVLHYIYTHHFASTINWKIFELKIYHKRKFRVKKKFHSYGWARKTRWQKGDVI